MLLHGALVVVLATLAPFTTSGQGPQVGRVAPEPGLRGFLQAKGAPACTLAELRGRVVVLHTFAWNCSPCLRVGIPLAADLHRANQAHGLTVLSVTTPAFPEETKEVLAKYGVEHPVAAEHPFENDNPYVDAMANPITYAFVVGRNGELVWRGDPSSKLDECLEAVRHALHQTPGRELERPLAPELADAVVEYFTGRAAKARILAEKVRKRHARKTKEESRRITADAEHLIERIDSRSEMLLSELEEALEAEDPVRFVRARDEIAAFHAKSDVAKRATPLLERAEETEAFAAAVAVEDAWGEIARARPPLFPLRREKAEKRFEKALKKYLDKNPDSPHRKTAEAWLTAFAAGK